MTRKIVDVFVRDRLVASYPVVLTLERRVMDEDFVERVKEQMRAGSQRADDVACARFVVRSLLDRD
jgi:hypothetical protein